MQQPVQYEIEALDDEAIKSILAPFKGRHVKIAVEEVEQEQILSQMEIYEKVMEVRKLFKDVKVDPNINLSDLANEVNL
jgi:hypothetical protein